jgi:hypothetical protein
MRSETLERHFGAHISDSELGIIQRFAADGYGRPQLDCNELGDRVLPRKPGACGCGAQSAMPASSGLRVRPQSADEPLPHSTQYYAKCHTPAKHARIAVRPSNFA